MSRIDAPPPKLTPDLCAKIEAKDHSASPLDWIAATAGVRKQTVRRWIKRANAVRKSSASGPIASKWNRFVDAVDRLVAKSADHHVDMVTDIAENAEGKVRLDARLTLLKRLDKQEEQLEACDQDVDKDDSIAHVPQELLDELSSVELEALETAQEALMNAVARVDQILGAASERLAISCADAENDHTE